jgi:F-type H+-transporting ATPase subunit gamma
MASHDPGDAGVTRLRDLELHRHSLAEIRDILNSMKTLAYMETRKLARFLDTQRAVVGSIEEAAADLLHFYPETLPGMQASAAIHVLIGSERGFCGDFNRSLLRRLTTALEPAPGEPLLLAVGHKLATLLQDDPRVAAFIEGASVVEDVPRLLHQLVAQLTTLQEQRGGLIVHCLFHTSQAEIGVRQLLPPFQSLPSKPVDLRFAPALNLPPRQALSGLSEQYVLAALHEMLYASLWAENFSRVSHLEGAVKHLDDQSAELTRQSHALRQEEIVEEIEVMLLSADQPGLRWRPEGRR